MKPGLNFRVCEILGIATSSDSKWRPVDYGCAISGKLRETNSILIASASSA